jgi:hypothetical protein
LAVPIAHVVGSAVVGSRLARQPGVDAPRATAALLICHWAYGVGFWQGIGRIVTGRAFDARPGRGGR